jgi:carboxyl-terminal processing protease
MTDKPIKAHVQPHASTEVLKPKRAKTLSSNAWFIIIAATAVVGFFGGMNSNRIMSVIGPVFGQKIYAGDIDLSSIQSTYHALKANYDGNLNDKSLIEGANKGLVAAAGDAYTLYMNSAESTTFSDDLTGNIGGGIGAEIGLRNNQVYIIRVLKSNPAEKAGLMAGDVIMAVNDQSTAGWTVDKTVGQIRGNVGTTVKVTVLRGTDSKNFTITRDTITNPSVDSSVVNGVGILTISRFDSETSSLARAAAQDFKTQGVKGVILDLRGDGGGYVDAAQDVAGLWLDGKVVVTEKTNNVVVSQIKSGGNPILASLPTIVLVDSGTASASEIVSGALQDYKVAKLVGEKTFGKGSVQKLISLPDGAELKVTIARWYTPSGKNITKEGITPDVTASITQQNVNDGVDPQMDAAKKALGL